MGADDFLRRYACTDRFTYGQPGEFTVSPDGSRVAFLRSEAGTDPVTRLRVLDLDSGQDRLIADPDLLLGGGAEDLPAQERARRERSRQGGGGIVAYSTDRAAGRAAFALSGRLWSADLVSGAVAEIEVTGPVVDPRLDPAGQRIGYVCEGALRVVGFDGSADAELAAPEGPDISYGLAEHVAAEEMGRSRGFWWSPDGDRLLVARVDVTTVQRWYIADPANPQDAPQQIAYPAAGTANADVSLWLAGLDGERTEVRWDRAAFEYLVDVCWDPRLLIVVQSRDQRVVQVLEVDPASGQTELVREERDEAWVNVAPGLPATTASGGLVWITAADDSYRLLVDGRPVTPPGLQVREVLDVDGDTVLFSASTDPTETHLWTHDPGAGLDRLTQAPGVYDGTRAGGVTVVTRRSLDHDGTLVHAERDGAKIAEISGRARVFGLDLRIELLRVGQRDLATAVLLPSWHQPGSGRLPVLMDPYGGPALQLVVHARNWWFGLAQWFAEQGFAVVIADGRGTPGRGPVWDRMVRGDIGGPPLDDQVEALHAAADRYPDLDLGRVGIRGWSFGGFLAALAVLRRPDVFHAAIAGAAISDQRLYDTYYKERFLGHPATEPENYERCSLLPEAAKLERPLMLIHGLADDNVVAANTLRFSAALLAAGRPHTVLPLSGTTHMLARPEVTENLLRLELDFLRRALA
jgi:dipeptidyl-peptidase-4